MKCPTGNMHCGIETGGGCWAMHCPNYQLSPSPTDVRLASLGAEVGLLREVVEAIALGRPISTTADGKLCALKDGVFLQLPGFTPSTVAASRHR